MVIFNSYVTNYQRVQFANWKDPPSLVGKSTISMGHFQVRKVLNY